MMTKLTLVKGPTLQKLLLLTLLTFAGLGYPPQLCQAFKCHRADCEIYDNGTETCRPGGQDCDDANAKTCHWRRDTHGSDSSSVQKGCHGNSFGGKGDGYFNCMQKELSQHGDCFKGSGDQYKSATEACGYPARESSTGLEYCKCNTELCNEKMGYSEEKNGGGGGNGGGKGDKASGHLVTPEGKVIQVGIIGLMIMRCHFLN